MREWIEERIHSLTSLTILMILKGSVLLYSPSMTPQEECEADEEAETIEVPLRWGEQPLDVPDEVTPTTSEQEDEEWDEQCIPEDEEETDEAGTYIYIV